MQSRSRRRGAAEAEGRGALGLPRTPVRLPSLVSSRLLGAARAPRLGRCRRAAVRRVRQGRQGPGSGAGGPARPGLVVLLDDDGEVRRRLQVLQVHGASRQHDGVVRGRQVRGRNEVQPAVDGGDAALQ